MCITITQRGGVSRGSLCLAASPAGRSRRGQVLPGEAQPMRQSTRVFLGAWFGERASRVFKKILSHTVSHPAWRFLPAKVDSGKA